MDPELKVKDCQHLFKCRLCEHVFQGKLPYQLSDWEVRTLSPLGNVYCHHECPDGTGAISVADFIALIPINKLP
jgi:hypothetical protein